MNLLGRNKANRSRVVLLALPLLAAAPASAQTSQPFWTATGSGPPEYPRTLVVYDDGFGSALYAVGEANDGDHIWRWSGENWTDLSATWPPGFGSRAAWISVLDDGTGPALYAVGWIQPSGVISYWGRRWNGMSWVPTPNGFIAPDGTAGPFMSANLGDGQHIYGAMGNPNTTGLRVSEWNGSQWLPISEPILFPTSLNLSVFDDGAGPRLYALGGFYSVGSIQVNGFARWTGSTWEAAPTNYFGLGIIYDTAVYNDGNGPALYAFGYIYPDQSSQEIPGVGRWNGQSWVNLGGPTLCPTCIYTRSRIEVFDDGSGPALYVTGGFTEWGGVEAHGIAKWNGQVWSAVGAGVHPGAEVNDMVVGPGPAGPTLYMGGILERAGGGDVRYIAALVGCPNCYANCDYSTRSPALNVLDFICFLNRFAARDPYANCDGSTTAPAINVQDFVCFLNKFAAGCP